MITFLLILSHSNIYNAYFKFTFQIPISSNDLSKFL